MKTNKTKMKITKKENKIIKFLEKHDPRGYKTGIFLLILMIFFFFMAINSSKEKFNPDSDNCDLWISNEFLSNKPYYVSC